MLKDEEILPVCYYWAKRFCSRNIEFNELVSVAYCAIKEKVDNPKKMQKWAKFTMLRFVNNHYNEMLLSLSDENENGVLSDTIPDDSIDEIEMMEVRREIANALMSTCSETDAIIIYQRFWLGWSQVEIAKHLEVTKQRVQQRIDNALGKLKRELVRNRDGKK